MSTKMILLIALTFDFWEDVSKEPDFVFRVRGFSFLHTVVEVFQHVRLENNYANCIQGAGRVLAQHIDNRVQHGVRNLLRLYVALT